MEIDRRVAPPSEHCSIGRCASRILAQRTVWMTRLQVASAPWNLNIAEGARHSLLYALTKNINSRLASRGTIKTYLTADPRFVASRSTSEDANGFSLVRALASGRLSVSIATPLFSAAITPSASR